MITYISWWYLQEPVFIWKAIVALTKRVFHTFSINILLSTLFAPWKKDLIRAENVSLDVQFKIAIENLISRFVGFIIRFFTVIIGLIVTLMIFILGVAFIIFWFFVPVIIIWLIYQGIIKIAGNYEF